MIEIILLVLFILTAFIGIKYYSLNKEANELKMALLYEYKKDPTEDDLVKEQFLKFVSDSREWAFEYIESVQIELSKIVNDLAPAVTNKDYEEKDILEKTYKRLKALLPEEDS